MRHIISYLVIVVWVAMHVEGYAQQVLVSPDISIRSTESYYLIGRIEDQILLSKTARPKPLVLVYNDQLVLQSERELNLITPNSDILHVMNLDTAFGVFYSYRQKRDNFLQLDIFNEKVELVDSLQIMYQSQADRRYVPLVTSSENQRYHAFYQILSDDELWVAIFDMQSMKLIKNKIYFFESADLQDEFITVKITNRGHFIALANQNNSRSNKEQHQAIVYRIMANSDNVDEIYIPLQNYVCSDITLSINNPANTLAIMALCDEDRFNHVNYLIYLQGDITHWSDEQIYIHPIDRQILLELYASKRKRKQKMTDFFITDVFWKNKNSPIIVLEKQQDIQRVAQNNAFTFATNNINGWSDHFREELVLLSLDKTGKKQWHRVLYKKQISQNDQAVFASYFPMVTPSRIRLIFNDEIKEDNTVSEYIFDGSGNFKRNSVMSTEYEKLNLRFTNALQMNSTELLVPSQSTYTLNLVKIDFAESNN